MIELYTCPCCGYKTLKEQPTNTFLTCKVCLWEDDGVQFDNPDFEDGANSYSLRHAQQNFLLKDKAEGQFEKDPDWKPVAKNDKTVQGCDPGWPGQMHNDVK